MAPLRLAPALLRALFLLCLVASSLAGLFKDAPKVTKDVTKLHVGVKHRPASCEQVAKAGDHCYSALLCAALCRLLPADARAKCTTRAS